MIQQGQVFKLKATCATEAVVGPTAIASQATVRQDCTAMNRIELHPVVGFRLVSKCQ
jgi:hypothetical protein